MYGNYLYFTFILFKLLLVPGAGPINNARTFQVNSYLFGFYTKLIFP